MTVRICPTCCPQCHAFPCETTGAARQGGGYHRRCPNGHEWDDTYWAYGLPASKLPPRQAPPIPPGETHVRTLRQQWRDWRRAQR